MTKPTILMRIDAREFDKLADSTKLGKDAREMARLFFVDGVAMTDIAHTFSVTRQRVSLAVHSIRRAHQENSATRSGWVDFNMEVPDKLSTCLAEFIAALKATKGRDVKAAALAEAEAGLLRARKTLGPQPAK